jgi:biotin transport system substrate-specific component
MKPAAGKQAPGKLRQIREGKMFDTRAIHPTLIGQLWPEKTVNALRWGVLILLGSLFLTACAQITVWRVPVPVTMQTFGVLVIGAVYGWRLGAATLGAYLIEGAIGLPVFAEMSGGLHVLAGPTSYTAGYLYGFVLSAAVVGWLAERGWDRNVVTTAVAMLIGNILLYVPGLAWLAALIGWDGAIAGGLLPFIWIDLIKLAAAAVLLPVAWQFVKRP